jgi:Tfp pilus assembly protein PilE
MVRWMMAVPTVGVIIVVAWPLLNYVRREQAHAEAAGLMEKLRTAQEAFRATGGGYASELASLTSPCPGQMSSPLPADDLSRVAAAGYEVAVRPAASGESRGVDCHGRSTVSDYYALAQPRSPETLAQQAFATTASAGRIFVFFDGLAPLESDMGPDGLATPLEALGSFKIP